MKTNGFDRARFWNLTRRNLIEERKTLMYGAGVIFGIYLLVTIFMVKNFVLPDGSKFMWNRWDSDVLVAAYGILGVLMVMILGSLTFRSMSSKSKRIKNMMLPASKSEKYWSNVLIYVVMGNLLLLVSAIICDTIVSGFCGHLPCMFEFFKEIRIVDGKEILALILLIGILYILPQSVYVLGSAIWPKRSFIKTFVALFVIQVVISILLPPFFNLFNVSTDSVSSDGVIYLRICLALLAIYGLSVGTYYLAWVRFKRMELVQRFMKE